MVPNTIPSKSTLPRSHQIIIEESDDHPSGFTPAQEDMEPDVPLPPAPTGKIVLQHSSSLIGDILYEGSVFLDGKPVCDNAWGHNEALVACR